MTVGTPPLSVTNNADARAVRVLQELLVNNGASIRIDGRFAIGTQRALGAFQTEHGLDASGIADEATWEKLLNPKAKPAKKPSTKKAPAKKSSAKKD